MVVLALFGSRGLQTVTATPVLAAMTADVRPALLLLLAAAMCAVIQALLGVRIFAPSPLVRILRSVGEGFR